MSYTKHSQIHSDRATEDSPDKEGAFSYSALSVFSLNFICCRNEHSDNRNGKKVYPAPHDQFLGKLSLRPTTRLKVPSFLVSLQKYHILTNWNLSPPLASAKEGSTIAPSIFSSESALRKSRYVLPSGTSAVFSILKSLS